MPLDFPLDGVDPRIFGSLPDNVNFDVAHEPTRMSGKKYVVNQSNGEVLGIVGKGYPVNPHPVFFRRVQAAITDTLSWNDLDDAKVRWQTSRFGAFALMDITLPNVKYTVTTDRHQTEVAQRVIALHGLDGLCSNQIYYGAIDFFCTNGMLSGDHTRIKRKNTTNWDLDTFIEELNKAKVEFNDHGRLLQTWADKQVVAEQVHYALKAIVKSDRKAEKLTTLYLNEASTRGHNVFSLYSALTNFATYADERNDFKLRETAADTEAVTMFKREQQVNDWVSHPAFLALAA
tara:strand:+ start:990 stop:1856 length:867 start_codon:yes stop_codon:yes gene_type:complete